VPGGGKNTDPKELEQFTLAIASGEINKDEVISRMRRALRAQRRKCD
jgi:hypothetical protein